MDEVPTGLRKRMSDQLSGPNTRTLIVADRRGREYLLKVLQRATNSATSLKTQTAPAPVELNRISAACLRARRYWLEIALIGLLGAAGWALFAWK